MRRGERDFRESTTTRFILRGLRLAAGLFGLTVDLHHGSRERSAKVSQGDAESAQVHCGLRRVNTDLMWRNNELMARLAESPQQRTELADSNTELMQ